MMSVFLDGGEWFRDGEGGEKGFREIKAGMAGDVEAGGSVENRSKMLNL